MEMTLLLKTLKKARCKNVGILYLQYIIIIIITSISGERREAEFLRQRLSLATFRGNAQSVTQAGRPSS